jgi:dihydrolipoamide dehydrogenase
MSTEVEVEVAVIGAGSAGLVARQQALEHGATRVLLIEGGVYGTTCARVGCMPSKVLIAAADAAERARGAAAFGIQVGDIRIDGAEVMARVRRLRDRFVAGVVRSTEAIDARDRLRGWARFVGPQSLIVETDAGSVRVEARAIVIAAGSSPVIPASLQGLGGESDFGGRGPKKSLGERLLTSDSVFELPKLPATLAVVGSGVIGLELGSAMHRLGVATKILDIGARMPLMVSDVMQAEARELFAERLDLHLGLRELASERVDDGVRLRWTERDGQTREAVFEYVLAATGRAPQLARLGLEAAGIELDERGMPKCMDHRTMRIGESAIFMAGDISGAHPILHEAVSDGRIAGANAARYPKVRAHVRQVPLGIMFTEPNVAIVGQVPTQGEGVAWSVGEVDYRDQGRARVMNQAHGRARVYARRECGTIFAAELIGPGVEHMAHLLAWAVEQRVTAQRALELPIYHPVLEEGLRTAIAKLAHALSLSGEPGPLDCGPGN